MPATAPDALYSALSAAVGGGVGVGDGVGLGAGIDPDELMPPPPPHAASSTATEAAVEFLKMASRLLRLPIIAPTPEPPSAWCRSASPAGGTAL